MSKRSKILVDLAQNSSGPHTTTDNECVSDAASSSAPPSLSPSEFALLEKEGYPWSNSQNITPDNPPKKRSKENSPRKPAHCPKAVSSQEKCIQWLQFKTSNKSDRNSKRRLLFIPDKTQHNSAYVKLCTKVNNKHVPEKQLQDTEKPLSMVKTYKTSNNALSPTPDVTTSLLLPKNDVLNPMKIAVQSLESPQTYIQADTQQDCAQETVENSNTCAKDLTDPNWQLPPVQELQTDFYHGSVEVELSSRNVETLEASNMVYDRVHAEVNNKHVPEKQLQHTEKSLSKVKTYKTNNNAASPIPDMTTSLLLPKNDVTNPMKIAVQSVESPQTYIQADTLQDCAQETVENRKSCAKDPTDPNWQLPVVQEPRTDFYHGSVEVELSSRNVETSEASNMVYDRVHAEVNNKHVPEKQLQHTEKPLSKVKTYKASNNAVSLIPDVTTSLLLPKNDVPNPMKIAVQSLESPQTYIQADTQQDCAQETVEIRNTCAKDPQRQLPPVQKPGTNFNHGSANVELTFRTVETSETNNNSIFSNSNKTGSSCLPSIAENPVIIAVQSATENTVLVDNLPFAVPDEFVVNMNNDNYDLPSQDPPLLEVPVDNTSDLENPVVSNIVEVLEPISLPLNNDGINPELAVLNDEVVNVGIKRVKKPTQWIANVAKVARNAGQAYTSKEGKEFPAKKMRRGCGTSCKLKCYTRVTEEDRQEVFNAFYKIESQTRKWDFITFHVHTQSPKRAKVKENPSRSCARTYHFRLRGKMVKVCSSMFLDTLCISDFVVRTAFRKLGPGGTISPDKRGGRRPAQLIPEKIIESIKNHVNSFPQVASHYCRENSRCKYLEADVGSVSNMHRLYLEEMEKKQTKKEDRASARQYRETFENMGIKFHKPRKDQCNTCFAWKLKEGEKSAQETEAYESHILKKDLAQKMKAKDREEAAKNPLLAVCAYDLQKVLLVPKCEASDLYYKRKLSVYNFTVYDMGQHEGTCFVWHEAIGHRGANEIVSFVFQYIQEKSATGIKRFIFYSDNCTGQNKNRYMFAMYMLAAVKFNVCIEHRFLTTGHTQNEADSMHALIERKSHRQDIYIPETWCKIMESAKSSGKPYIVKRVQQKDILNFHPLVQAHCSWPQNINWLEVTEVVCNADSPWELRYKYDLGDLPTTFKVKPKVPGRPVNLQTYQVPQAYASPLPLNLLKKKDLDSLCHHSEVIPNEHRPFFTTLLADDNVEDEHYAP